MSLMDTVKWKKQIGIELTLVPTAKKYHGTSTASDDYWRSAYISKLRGRVADLDNCEYGINLYNRISTDPGCIEIPSPILRSWEEARDWYITTTAIAESVGLVPFRGNDMMGGGGHIHIGELSDSVKLSMFRDMMFRPYVSWALLNPADDINAKSLLVDSVYTYATDAQALAVKLTSDQKRIDRFCGYEYVPDRCSILNFNDQYETVEWRAFDAAADWEIQEQHIAIVQRYVALCSRKYKAAGFHYGWKNSEILALRESWSKNLDRCIRDFRSFIQDDLELPWKDFEWYVDRNLVLKLTKGWSEIL